VTDSNLPRIALILTGGTIDSAGSSRTDLAWYYETGERLSPEELLASVPEIGEVAAVELVGTRRLSSHALADRDWLDLVAQVRDLLGRDSIDGVVVSHGTNTLEETAYLLHLTAVSPKPVVVVGAMRPPSALGSDAGLNLLRSVQVAASPDARGHGVLVVVNDTIFSARDVTKTATYRVDAFRAGDLGPLGYADADNQVVFYHRHLRVDPNGSRFRLQGATGLPRVDVVTSYVGADGALVEAAVAAGAVGIVSAGTGAGRPTPGEQVALEAAAERGVVICQATRVGSGRVALSLATRRAQWVSADNLQPWKAKVLLALALTVTADAEAIQQMFDTL
jgi:L-asparaginase